jgi:hypothetical protein
MKRTYVRDNILRSDLLGLSARRSRAEHTRTEDHWHVLWSQLHACQQYVFHIPGFSLGTSIRPPAAGRRTSVNVSLAGQPMRRLVPCTHGDSICIKLKSIRLHRMDQSTASIM